MVVSCDIVQKSFLHANQRVLVIGIIGCRPITLILLAKWICTGYLIVVYDQILIQSSYSMRTIGLHCETIPQTMSF